MGNALEQGNDGESPDMPQAVADAGVRSTADDLKHHPRSEISPQVQMAIEWAHLGGD